MKRILRPGGTIAFWGYKDGTFVDYSKATHILREYADEKSEQNLGLFWSQLGRDIIQNKLRDLQPPPEDFENIQRIEYETGMKGP